ncbi:MAG: hypothetical protein AB7O61_24835 [Acidimicrobiia bacterium]
MNGLVLVPALFAIGVAIFGFTPRFGHLFAPKRDRPFDQERD